jgi:hypothetical protein
MKTTEITKKINSNVIGEVNPVMIPTSSVPGVEKLVFHPPVRKVPLSALPQ